jgi:short-subunit dehydrogenase involved in D-alanine esterification of teichoic acids
LAIFCSQGRVYQGKCVVPSVKLHLDWQEIVPPVRDLSLSQFQQQERGMMNIEPDASHTPDVLRNILEEIEVLRMKRQEEVRDRPHPFLKRFTLAE